MKTYQIYYNKETFSRLDDTYITYNNGGKIQNIHVVIPNKPIECCEFLYGKEWKVLLSK